MNPVRRSVLVGGVACAALLMFLMLCLAPPPAKGVWNPQTSKLSGPKDPGTPYEEPESEPDGGQDPKPPEEMQGGNPPTGAAGMFERLPSGLLQPVAWRIGLLFVTKL